MHSPADLPRIVKNECVDRFWQAIDTYCRPVTDEDIKFLEEQINKTEEEESSFFKVPSLGRHYKDVWAEEDLIEEMQEGTPLLLTWGNRIAQSVECYTWSNGLGSYY